VLFPLGVCGYRQRMTPCPRRTALGAVPPCRAMSGGGGEPDGEDRPPGRRGPAALRSRGPRLRRHEEVRRRQRRDPRHQLRLLRLHRGVPLLLVLVSILNLVLAMTRRRARRSSTRRSVEFPVVGASSATTSTTPAQLGRRPRHRHRGLIWARPAGPGGALSMAQVWNLPGPSAQLRHRLGQPDLPRRARGRLVITTALASFGHVRPAQRGARGPGRGRCRPRQHRACTSSSSGCSRPRSWKAGCWCPGRSWAVGWTLLLALGGYLVGHDLRNDSSTYGVFGVVLGLIAWIYLARSSPSTPPSSTRAPPAPVAARLVQPPAHRGRPALDDPPATQNQRRPEQRWRSTTTSRHVPDDGCVGRGRGSRRSGRW